MRVKDVMTREVVSVPCETPLKEVARLMTGRAISGVPVVDDQGHVLGIVSESDFLLKDRGEASPPRERHSRLYRHDVAALEAKLEARTAGDAMTSPAITIHPESSLAQAATEMVERGVNRMPVVQGGRLLGILTRADLVRAFARDDEDVAREIREVLRTLRLPLEAVSVAVGDGEVWLTGELETAGDAKALLKEVRQIAGVVAVHSTVRGRHEERAPGSDRTLPPAGEEHVDYEEPVLIHEP
jgi:CBS domain-containing protein